MNATNFKSRTPQGLQENEKKETITEKDLGNQKNKKEKKKVKVNIHFTKMTIMNLYLLKIVIAVTAVLAVNTLTIAKLIRGKILRKKELGKLSLSLVLGSFQKGDGKLSKKKSNNFNLLIPLYQLHLLLIHFLQISNAKQKIIYYQKRLSFILITSYSNL